jgi:hypothetical protein
MLIPQRNVQNPALTAVHRVEAEWRTGVLDLFGGGARADPQLLDPQGPIIVRVEGYARMIVGVETQNLLRHEFQSQQKLGAIGQEHLHIAAIELYQNVRSFEFGMTVVAGLDGKVQVELACGDDLAEKLLNPGTSLMN